MSASAVVLGQPQPQKALDPVVCKRFVMLLDESGSMQSIKDDIIGSVNGFFEKLRRGETPMLCTLKCFDAQKQHYLMREVPISVLTGNVLSRETYNPAAGTPLYDAMGKLMTDIRQGVKPGEEVLFVTVTDGQENASKEWKKDAIKALIEELQERGWTFVFLGTGFDAYAEAQSLGVGAGRTMSYDKGMTGAMFESVGEATERWARSEVTQDWALTPDEKKASGDTTEK